MFATEPYHVPNGILDGSLFGALLLIRSYSVALCPVKELLGQFDHWGCSGECLRAENIKVGRSKRFLAYHDFSARLRTGLSYEVRNLEQHGYNSTPDPQNERQSGASALGSV